MRDDNFFVYITTNPGKTTFYTGVTNDLKRRLEEHYANKGKKETFAGKYFCHKLIYYERFDLPEHAIEREKEIKKLSHQNKLQLIKIKNPKLIFYSL